MVKPCNAKLSKGEAMPCRVMHCRGVAACCAAKRSIAEAMHSDARQCVEQKSEGIAVRYIAGQSKGKARV